MTKFTFESDEEGITSVSVRITYKDGSGQGLLNKAMDLLAEDESKNSSSAPIQIKTKGSNTDKKSNDTIKTSSSSGDLFNMKGAKARNDIATGGLTPPSEMTDFSKF